MSKTTDAIKAWLKSLGLGVLKAFRGLICEQKAGGWELSKGAVMSWILFYYLLRVGQEGMIDAQWLVYMFGGLMGYNAFKLVDLKGTLGRR